MAQKERKSQKSEIQTTQEENKTQHEWLHGNKSIQSAAATTNTLMRHSGKEEVQGHDEGG